MIKLSNKTQQTLNNIQFKIKERLEQIQYLDLQCLKMQCNIQQLRQAYLEQIKYEYLNQNEQLINIEDIAKLQQQLKSLAQKKVRIAEQIQHIVAKCSLQIQRQMFQNVQQFTNGTKNIKQEIKMNHLSQFGIVKNKGRQQQKIISNQIKTIVKEYYDQKESQNTFYEQPYCICKSSGNNTYSGSMIECQNPCCKIGWYHFECVNIKSNDVPNHWICPLCQSQSKNVKKVIFKQQNQQIQLELHNKVKEENQQVSLKRKRGRPRKFQSIP